MRSMRRILIQEDKNKISVVNNFFVAKKDLKLSTMVGENVEIYFSQMAKNTLKLSTMVGEIFEIYLPQMAKNAPKLSTMVGENFEICLFQILKII